MTTIPAPAANRPFHVPVVRASSLHLPRLKAAEQVQEERVALHEHCLMDFMGTAHGGGVQGPPSGRSWMLSAALGLGLLFAVTGCSRPARDFSAVQAALIEHSGCEWQRTIRVGLPAGLFSVARWGLRFVDLEPEARAALDTMHGVRVAIHQLAHGNADRAAMLAAADTALLPRGWERVVGVLERKEMVAVYLPSRLKAGDLLELCVVVFDGEQLVLVSGRADPEPLVELALRHTAEHRAQWFAHSRPAR